MNNIWCEDVVHTMMHYADIKTICVMKLVNKISNSALNSKHFWEHIFKRDYESFNPLGGEWQTEYKNVYLSYKKMIELTSVSFSLEEPRNINSYDIWTSFFEFDIQKCYWLPPSFTFDPYSDILFETSDLKHRSVRLVLTLTDEHRFCKLELYAHNGTLLKADKLHAYIKQSTLRRYIFHLIYNYPNVLISSAHTKVITPIYPKIQ